MSLYSELAETADDLLADFGAAVTLTKIGTGTYNPATGAATQTGTTYTAVGAKFDYEQKDIDGTKIKHGDQRLYLSPKQTNGADLPTPSTDDRVTIGSAVFSVVASRPLSPAGTVVLHDVQLRGV